MKLATAKMPDMPELLGLYRACAAQENSVWDEYYPNTQTAAADIAAGSLYLLRGRGALVACASIIAPEDEERGSMYRPCRNPCALARIGVHPAFQGRGYGGLMLRLCLRIARAQGRDSMRLLVGPRNRPAVRMYHRAGFQPCGMRRAWGEVWICMERGL